MLSVIVPVYNAETFLPESLDSLLKVRLDEPYEIIAVDDGSADGTPEILRAYAEEHEHIRILTKKSGGVSRARNTGIEEARGKYITFADGDEDRSFRIGTISPEGDVTVPCRARGGFVLVLD